MKQASAAHIGAEPDSRRQRVSKIVIAYPFGVLAIALAINLLCFEISGFEASIPGQLSLSAFALAAIVFCLNHSWLMTATELTRVRYHMYATPEEWKASGTSIDDISRHAIQELERTHNAHRNSNENTLYFLALSLPFMFSNPSGNAAIFWFASFALARLAYTYSYLNGKDGMRGISMTVGLTASYGLASYIALSLATNFFGGIGV